MNKGPSEKWPHGEAVWPWLFFKGLSVRVSLSFLRVYIPSVCSQFVVSLLVENWLVANSPAFAMAPGMPSSAFLPGCLWPHRRPQVPGDLQKQCFTPILSSPPQKKQKHSHCQEPWGLAMRNRCLPQTYHPCSTAAWGHHLGAGKGSGSRAHPPCSAPRVQCQGQQTLFVIGDCTLLHPHKPDHQYPDSAGAAAQRQTHPALFPPHVSDSAPLKGRTLGIYRHLATNPFFILHLSFLLRAQLNSSSQ